MPQHHTRQSGIFHITMVTKDRIPWCTREGVPAIIIDNLVMTRNIHHAKLYAFSILPDHVHVIIEPRRGGLSQFIQSLKSHSSREINMILFNATVAASHELNATVAASHELNATVAASHGSLLAATHESPLRMRHDEHSFKETKRNTIAWQKGYYDERIRDGRQFTHAMHYVQGNAMRHRLVQDILDWPWSSLLYPHLWIRARFGPTRQRQSLSPDTRTEWH